MSGDQDTEQPTMGRPRRSSLVELFSYRPQQDASSTGSSTKPIGTSMASAMSQQAQQEGKSRRLSITTLGLSGSPTHGQQTSPFGTLRRGQSSSAAMRPSVDEADTAVEEVDGSPSGSYEPRSPSFGRRLSFGARAYHELRTSSGGSAGGSDGASASPPSVRSKGKR